MTKESPNIIHDTFMHGKCIFFNFNMTFLFVSKKVENLIHNLIQF